MSLLLLYGQITLASYFFMLYRWFSSKEIRNRLSGGPWTLTFIIGTMVMAILWFLYVPLFIFQGGMMERQVTEMMDNHNKKIEDSKSMKDKGEE